jgi:hypothetical protein
MSNAMKVRPFFLDAEMLKLHASKELPTVGSPVFGDTLSHQLSWSAGGKRMNRNIAVSVLGTQDDVFQVAPELFMSSALKLGGEPIFSPPPFAAPCTDGLLIIFTFRRSSGDLHDVHGGYILIDKKELEAGAHPAASLWSRAQKPADAATTLRTMGFGETRPWMLN